MDLYMEDAMVVAVEAMQAKGGGWQIRAAEGSGVPRAAVYLWPVNSLGDGLFLAALEFTKVTVERHEKGKSD